MHAWNTVYVTERVVDSRASPALNKSTHTHTLSLSLSLFALHMYTYDRMHLSHTNTYEISITKPRHQSHNHVDTICNENKHLRDHKIILKYKPAFLIPLGSGLKISLFLLPDPKSRLEPTTGILRLRITILHWR